MNAQERNKYFFECGLKTPYRFIVQKEAIHDACYLLGYFFDDSADYLPPLPLDLAANEGGRYVASIRDDYLRNGLKDYWYQCIERNPGELVKMDQRLYETIRKKIAGYKSENYETIEF